MGVLGLTPWFRLVGWGVAGVYLREGETWRRNQPVSQCWWMPTLPGFGTLRGDGAGSTVN